MSLTDMNRIFRALLLATAFASETVSCHAKILTSIFNHPFDRVEIAYTHNECSFQYSSVDFCDERHVSQIKDAIARSTANFKEHYILVKIQEWTSSEHYGNSLVAIDALTGVAYPLPFDYYSGRINMRNSRMLKKPKLNFSAKSGKVCIDGSILVFRATINGSFCFDFDGKKFTGFKTEYMN
jgi:hypothetical protein